MRDRLIRLAWWWCGFVKHLLKRLHCWIYGHDTEMINDDPEWLYLVCKSCLWQSEGVELTHEYRRFRRRLVS